MKTKLLFLSIAFLCLNLFAQTQIGTDINGSESSEFFGQSVSLSSDGIRIVIGAPFNSVNGQSSGKVQIYDYNGNEWMQTGSDINGTGIYEALGFSTSISADGSRIAIGGYMYNGNTGYVSIYDWNGSNWSQVGSNIDGEATTDYSGYAIDLSSNGNRIVIGAIRNDGNGNASGHARVYDWNGSSWVQVGNDIDGENAGDESGNAVAISSDGNRVAIAASLNDGTAGYAGHVRIYDWNGSAWVQAGTNIDGEAGGDIFGKAVDLSSDGNRIAIGGWYNDGNGADAGHVRLFDWNGSDWIQTGTDIDGELGNDGSGMSVALSDNGNRVAIGAWGNDGGGSSSGHVRVYDWNGTNWVKTIEDIDGETSNDNFGTSVALSADGQILASGAIHSDGDVSDSGDVRVFDLTLEPNLMAYYPFNGNANDESGNNHHGTVYGPTLTTDRFGNADSAYHYHGNSNNDYIDIGDWENGGPMTINLWAKWEVFNNWGVPFDIGNGWDSDNIGIGNEWTSNILMFYVLDHSTKYLLYCDDTATYPNSPLTLNNWTMITCTVDETGLMKAYKNGELIGTFSGFTPTKMVRTEQYFGSFNYPMNGYFQGDLDDIRIYQSALSETDILSLYTNNSLKVENITSATASTFYVSKNTLHFKDIQNLHEIKSVEVYNLLGQQVFRTSKIEEQILLNNLTNGVFIAKVTSENGFETLKFLKN